jgi:hypothetical protein
LSPGESRGFAVFAGVFEGCFEKCGGLAWCLCGEYVASFVVKGGGKGTYFWWRKMRHIFELYFRLSFILGRNSGRV